MNSNDAWKKLMDIIRPIKLDIMQFTLYTGKQFSELFKGKLSENDSQWIADNVTELQCQCDSFGCVFTWENE